MPGSYALDAQGRPAERITRFALPYTLALDLSGVFDLAGSDRHIHLKYLDEARGEWVDLLLVAVDRENQRLVARLDHFSSFGTGVTNEYWKLPGAKRLGRAGLVARPGQRPACVDHRHAAGRQFRRLGHVERSGISRHGVQPDDGRVSGRLASGQSRLRPAPAYNPDQGHYPVAWADTRYDPGGLLGDILVQRVSLSGTLVGANTAVLSRTLDEFHAAVAYNPVAGEYLVAALGGAYDSVLAQRVSYTATAVGNVITVTTPTPQSGAFGRPAAAAESDGESVVVWTDQDRTGLQRLDLDWRAVGNFSGTSQRYARLRYNRPVWHPRCSPRNSPRATC